MLVIYSVLFEQIKASKSLKKFCLEKLLFKKFQKMTWLFSVFSFLGWNTRRILLFGTSSSP